ncbi:DUF2382 domain-containing protein [Paracoccus gahaiensis]|uniref:DUF2382 domain-containing protein n=2 Tax=Paracoccus gahaiensis TaxID=1706839 RepID=A0A4V5MVC6_9RHOB|nr:DUF2382 domain-containing protein [Paracoccus gahaiensis]
MRGGRGGLAAVGLAAVGGGCPGRHVSFSCRAPRSGTLSAGQRSRERPHCSLSPRCGIEGGTLGCADHGPRLRAGWQLWRTRASGPLRVGRTPCSRADCRPLAGGAKDRRPPQNRARGAGTIGRPICLVAPQEADMADDRDDAVLPVMEERLTITKDRRMTGRVRVSTSTETIDSTLPVELSGTEVHVVRVPIDRRIDEVPEITTSGELTIIPVVEERMVMTRELYLREEIHIRRIDFQDTQEVPVSVRRQTAHVEHLDPDEPGTAPLPSPSKDDRNDL